LLRGSSLRKRSKRRLRHLTQATVWKRTVPGLDGPRREATASDGRQGDVP